MSSTEFLLWVTMVYGIFMVYDGIGSFLKSDKQYAETRLRRLRSTARLEGAKSDEEIAEFIKNWKEGSMFEWLGRKQGGVAKILVGIVAIMFAGSYLFLVLPYEARSPAAASITRMEEKCDLSSQQQIPSDHVLVMDAFWMGESQTCFVVTKRPYMGAGSDWAVDAEKQGILDFSFVEATKFTLWAERDKEPIKEVLSRTYALKSLEEYMQHPSVYDEWEADFLRDVERYR